MPATLNTQLPGHGAGVPVVARRAWAAAAAGGARHLPRARHPVRELHPSAHDSVRACRPPASARCSRCCCSTCDLNIYAFVGHDHADRHRQEERHHDDRLRPRSAAHERQEAAREAIYEACAGPLPPDHDDHDGGADGHAADRAGPRRRRGIAPAPRPRGGRRPARVAGADALHHAGDLHLSRTRPGPAMRRRAA